MTKGTRYFIAIASLIVVAVFCTGVVAYYNGGLPLMARAAQEDLQYVPADSSVVAYANVRDIMNSEFRQKLRDVVPTGEGRNEFLAETGIDLERDVTSVLVAMNAAPAASLNATNVAGGDAQQLVKKSADSGIALVRGVFSQGQLEAAAITHGATQAEYKGKRMIIARHLGDRDTANTANQGMALAFVEPGMVVVGAEASVRAAIDAHAGANLSTNADMMRLINDLDGNNSAWAVGRLEDVQKVAGLPDAVKSQLPAIQWFAITGHVNGGVSGTIRAEARDDKAAENLRDVVRGAMALARLQMGHDQNLDNVINSLQMTGTGKTVSMSFAVPAETLDGLTGLARAVHLPAPDKK